MSEDIINMTYGDLNREKFEHQFNMIKKIIEGSFDKQTADRLSTFINRNLESNEVSSKGQARIGFFTANSKDQSIVGATRVAATLEVIKQRIIKQDVKLEDSELTEMLFTQIDKTVNGLKNAFEITPKKMSHSVLIETANVIKREQDGLQAISSQINYMEDVYSKYIKQGKEHSKWVADSKGKKEYQKADEPERKLIHFQNVVEAVGLIKSSIRASRKSLPVSQTFLEESIDHFSRGLSVETIKDLKSALFDKPGIGEALEKLEKVMDSLKLDKKEFDPNESLSRSRFYDLNDAMKKVDEYFNESRELRTGKHKAIFEAAKTQLLPQNTISLFKK